MVQNCGEGVRIKKISHNLDIVRSIGTIIARFCIIIAQRSGFVQAKKSLKIAKTIPFRQCY